MKVILNTDIEKIGEVGDIVEVKPGFARNYLFPKKMALIVTKNNLYLMKARKKKIQKQLEIERLSAEELKQKIEEITITIEKKAGENDVLFGSVTAQDIENKLGESGLNIDRKKFHLDEHIKRLGNYTCKIKLFKDVEAELRIEVVGEGGRKPTKAEEPEAAEKEKEMEADEQIRKDEMKVVEKKEDAEENKPKTGVKKASAEAETKATAEHEAKAKGELPPEKEVEKTKVSDKTEKPEKDVAKTIEKKGKKTKGNEKTAGEEKKSTEGDKKKPEEEESVPKSTSKKK